MNESSPSRYETATAIAPTDAGTSGGECHGCKELRADVARLKMAVQVLANAMQALTALHSKPVEPTAK